MRVALRVGKYKSSWDADVSDSEVARLEFAARAGGLDLRPSVYSVEQAEVVRALTEHLVQLRPPVAQGRDELLLNGLAPYVLSRREGSFAFTNERHAELHLADEADVLRLVGLVRADRERRRRRERSAIVRYVCDRLACGDPEWQAFMRSRADWAEQAAKWARDLDTQRDA